MISRTPMCCDVRLTRHGLWPLERMIYVSERRSALVRAMEKLDEIMPLPRKFSPEDSIEPSAEDFGEVCELPQRTFNRKEPKAARPRGHRTNIGLRLRRIGKYGTVRTTFPVNLPTFWPKARLQCAKCQSIFIKIWHEVAPEVTVKEVALFCGKCGEVLWYFLPGTVPLSAESYEAIALYDAEMDQKERELRIRPWMLAKDRVFAALAAGYSNSAEISRALRLPLKSVSAWLTVLWQHGEIQKEAELQLDKYGRKTHFYTVDLSLGTGAVLSSRM